MRNRDLLLIVLILVLVVATVNLAIVVTRTATIIKNLEMVDNQSKDELVPSQTI